MANYYLDIETTGLDSEKSKIITIQFQELDRFANPIGKLVILKEWESSEKEIIAEFISKSRILESVWSFVPFGYNLRFEHKFLLYKSSFYGFPTIDIANNPHIDLFFTGVIMNNGMFKGAALDKITGKPRNGSIIPQWYEHKEYGKIIDYIETETREYLRFANWLYKVLPEILKEFKKNIGK
ncbi:MAG: ribonuclease H-like domain-containing protein [Candidatus Parvarchaeota archaeon]|nr:ribonuclease H-like domain-containing protein [Candidatus Parvarchaeum tengchongense]MCW1295837.1 ribonuclease H-like domain-containing protein [Candidatus Parvarchaeum tengchongense]MCW1298988.1 ribonuclease H-like domain-containing protein [Candidatus Parvarchaeum tengchongense]MCW1312062.1 ribonuclease H-like domain-containing protein [Candidatus Parvarchaeum tengchongense]